MSTTRRLLITSIALTALCAIGPVLASALTSCSI